MVKRLSNPLMRFCHIRAHSSNNIPIGLQNKCVEEKEKCCITKKLSSISLSALRKTNSILNMEENARLFNISELFTMIRFPNVLSDNNLAERKLRHLVVSKEKISGERRSAKGSETKYTRPLFYGVWGCKT